MSYIDFLEERKRKDGITTGVFTSVKIESNLPIIQFVGKIFTDKNLPNDDVIQIGPNMFIGSSPNLDEKINHSCDPNCMLHIAGSRVILYSLYMIPADTELTIDYSVSSNDTYDSWKMDCTCGTSKCRKIISGFDYLDDKLKENYKKKGMVPLFIQKNIFMRK